MAIATICDDDQYGAANRLVLVRSIEVTKGISTSLLLNDLRCGGFHWGVSYPVIGRVKIIGIGISQLLSCGICLVFVLVHSDHKTFPICSIHCV
uniref:Transmembrane protein n=1 Tax=Elaeophora elaphi TaxID=1147741 RepID=A0A0R3RH93_9BILA